MGERFEVGDMVECVDARPAAGMPEMPLVLGELYTVTDADIGIDHFTGALGNYVMVDKAPLPDDCGWAASRFRRVYRPDSTLIVTLLSQPVLEDA